VLVVKHPRKRLSEQPQRRAVRNAVLDAEPQKPRERPPVAHLILDLVVRQIVKRCSTSIRNITMTSIGLRPALLFFPLTGVKTAASISATPPYSRTCSVRFPRNPLKR
jgi:hypothetical protein